MVDIGKAGRKRAVDIRWASWAILALLVVYVFAHFKNGPGANQVVGSPPATKVTGTWGGPKGTALLLRPDGTFTADGLPQRVGTAAPVFTRDGRDVVWAWSGHGTWAIGPGSFHGSPDSVAFTVDCAGASGCAGHPRVFELLLETNSPQGGGGPALFYYLDRTHDLDNQYPFVREQ